VCEKGTFSQILSPILFPALALLEEGLEGLLNKSKSRKAAFGVRSVREL